MHHSDLGSSNALFVKATTFWWSRNAILAKATTFMWNLIRHFLLLVKYVKILPSENIWFYSIQVQYTGVLYNVHVQYSFLIKYLVQYSALYEHVLLLYCSVHVYWHVALLYMYCSVHVYWHVPRLDRSVHVYWHVALLYMYCSVHVYCLFPTEDGTEGRKVRVFGGQELPSGQAQAKPMPILPVPEMSRSRDGQGR